MTIDNQTGLTCLWYPATAEPYFGGFDNYTA
jgi:hypothetical protein